MTSEFQSLIHVRASRSSGVIKGMKILENTNTSYRSEIKKALDEFFLECLLENGKCSVCKVDTNSFCSNCGVHYCGNYCQEVDWVKHQSTCQLPISRSTKSGTLNVSLFESRNSQCDTLSEHWSLNSNSPKTNKKGVERKNSPSKMSPKIIKTSLKEPNSRDILNNQENENYKLQKLKTENGRFNNSKKKTQKDVDYQFSVPINIGETSNNSVNYQRRDCNVVENLEKASTNRVVDYNEGEKMSCVRREAWEKVPLNWAKNLFDIGQRLKVRNVFSDLKSNIWVIQEKNLQVFDHMHNLLAENTETFEPVNEAIINTLYCTKHLGVWYRIKLLSIDPNRLLCIDTGKIFTANQLRLYKLPPLLETVDNLAFRVVFDDPPPDIALNSDTWMIEILSDDSFAGYKVKLCNEDDNFGGEVDKWEPVSNSFEDNSSGKRFVVDELDVGDYGLFTVMKITSGRLFGLILPKNNEEAGYCEKKLKSLCCEGAEIIKGSVGDLVMVTSADGRSHRGVILTKSEEFGYKVKLIDYGNNIETRKIFQLPDSVKYLIELGCMCTIQRKNVVEPFKLNATYMFEIKRNSYDGDKICILKDEEKILAEVIPQRVNEDAVEEINFNYIPLEPGCKVLISEISMDGLIVYVRRVDGSWREKFLKLCMSINASNMKSDEQFYRNIEVGDVVSVIYGSEDELYRGKILSKEGDEAKILYVDFGKEEICSSTKLKPLPDSLIKEPFFARPVRLLGYEKGVSEKGRHYLNELKIKEEKLIMTFKDLREGVVLTEKEECFDINQIVCDQSPEKSPENALDQFIEKFPKYQPFSIGIIQNFLILNVEEEEFLKEGIFWATDPINMDMSYILGEFEHDLLAYCNSIPNGHKPDIGDLCLALFEECWYRGLVIDKDEEQFQVFFIDFGNQSTLKAEAIRKIIPDFLKIPPAAVKCILDGEYKFLYDLIVKCV